MMGIRGTELLAKALQAEGVDMVFGYTGSYCMDIFDELYRQGTVEVVLPRHEQGLIHAADGYARSTGKVGVCIVTSGPGATNLVTGIATANYDSVPIVCFTGQVPTHLIGNDAFQEVDIVGITRSICKYGVTVRDRKDLNKIIKEAFYIAQTGKPGVVVVDLPKDIMMTLGDEQYPGHVSIRGYKPSTGVHQGQLNKAVEMLHISRKPLFLIGGGVNIAGANEELTKLIDKTKVPVVTTIMGRGGIDTAHTRYIGNLGMHGSYAANHAVSECDLLFSVGTRFNDRITGKIEEFASHAKIIHIDIDSSSIARNIKVDVPIVADAKEAIKAMLPLVRECPNEEWINRINHWKKTHNFDTKPDMHLTPQAIFRKINQCFSEGIFVTDVGQHQMWAVQHLEINRNKRLLTSGGLGTMGYGLPAAVGAGLGNTNKHIVCLTGDGGVQMNIQELATAVTNEVPLILCIFNNTYLGMVRQWQQLFYDKRYAITCLKRRKSCDPHCCGPNQNCPPYSPDFVKLAESYGACGIRIEKSEEIDPAFQQAMQNKKRPTVIEFMIDSDELVTPMVQSGKPLNEMIIEV